MRYKTIDGYGAGSGDVDPDADWMASVVYTPAATLTGRQVKSRYIPAVPVAFIQGALPSGDALPVLLIALMEMRMRGTGEIAIGPAVWSKVGDPSKRVRSRLLRQISGLPADLCRLVARKGRPHLLIAGPGWPAPIR